MPLKLITSGGGSVILDANTTGSNFTLTAPAVSASLFTSAGGTISGNVGIGTGSPSKRVEIADTNNSTSLTTGLMISNYSSTTDSRAGIVFQSFDNIGCSIWSRRTGSFAGDLCFGTKPESSGSVSESGITERMRIDSDGRVNLYGGGGGSQLRLRNGGDLTIFSAGETFGCTIWNDPPATGMDGAGQYLWTERLNLHIQRCGYDRLWDNYPTISVRNDTTNGPQGEFRIHGITGISGGDFSVVTRCDGGYVTGSDARRKINVENINNPLERTLQLSGKMFNIISKDGTIETDLSSESTGKKFGLIAQDAINIIPECIKFYPEADTPDANGWASAYSVDYPSITALLIETIKELNSKIEMMQTEIDVLKNRGS